MKCFKKCIFSIVLLVIVLGGYGAYVADTYCNVEFIEINGTLMTYGADQGFLGISESYGFVASDNIVNWIESADRDESIEAIVLSIDSPGGAPVAGEEIADALKRAQKPTVALIRGDGMSAAYWLATGADVIYASRNSAVGSIGVTMSYLDYGVQNETEGLTFNQISMGEYKDAGNPERSLTEEEKTLFEEQVAIVYDNFVDDVSVNRKIQKSKVIALADGSFILGEEALKNKLIDKIGGLYDVTEYLRNKFNIQQVTYCKY